MTRMEKAKKGEITDEVRDTAALEGIDPETLNNRIANGQIVIARNSIRKSTQPLGIGAGLRTKINANIGTSSDSQDIDMEIKKLETAIAAGADTVMDLSTGGDIDGIRKLIMEKSTIPVGTVPIYQCAREVMARGGKITDMTPEDLFNIIIRHAEDGVDFITVHCGVTIESVRRMEEEGRLLDIVSRGGAILADWMIHHNTDNPLFTQFERLLEIARDFDMTLSLGDGMRPGCIEDATDRAQIQETVILGELTKRAWDAGVQVIIEGPGHMPINQIEANVLLQKRLCHGAPFYVLGPLVTDIAPGYDHITSAIGGAIAASAGADFLCYVTPSEHLRIPDIDDVREGVIASRIAAHAADIGKGIQGAADKDREMSSMRKRLDWKGQISLALDPEKARKMRGECLPGDGEVCTMCSDLCAIKVMREKNK